MGYVETSRQKDFDQHASKIRLGLQNLTSEDSKRAIWELFQNAVDLTDKCHIRIIRTLEGVKFEHNGEHFNVDSLASLIKQVTNKTPGTKEDQVGQYGTGFITTHIYGKIIKLNGYVKVEDGFIPLQNFTIDRKEEQDKPLFKKIMEQDDAAATLTSLAPGKVATPDKDIFTSFHYQSEHKHNLDSIDAAIEYLQEIIPLVFVFNDRLSVVELHNGNTPVIYRRKETEPFDGYSIVRISKNDSEISFVCLFSEDEKRKLRIVLPYTAEFREKSIGCFPKIFLFYPLIGTEGNGINFIIHNHHFFPREKRDSLFLAFDNDDIAKDVEKNREIVTASVNMVLDFLKKNCKIITDGLAIAKVQLTKANESVERNFWEDEKVRFVNELCNIELVNTCGEKTSVTRGAFLHYELLHDKESLKSIYSLASQFWQNLPVFDDVFNWSTLVQSWNEPKGYIIGIKELFENVRAVGDLSKIANVEDYKVFLNYVLIHSKTDWFETYAVLPNIYGDFQVFSKLKQPIAIDPILVNVATTLFKDVPESFVHPDFIFDRVYGKYERADYKTDINAKAVSISDDTEKNIDVKFATIEALLRFCSINTTTDLVKQFVEHLSKFYAIASHSINVEDHVKDFDFRSPLKAIFKFFIFDITKRGAEWVKQNVTVIVDAHKIIYQNDDFKRTLLHELKAYPNQNYHLCSQKSIKIDRQIPPRLKEIYFSVINIDLKNQLALKEISEFMHEPESLTPDQIGNELEKVFHNDKIKYTEIVANPYKDVIISIVELITINEQPWKTWFSTLNSYRLEVLVGKMTDPQLRSSMFSILTKDDKTINLLGDLAKIKDLEDLVKKGKERQQEEYRHNNHLEYINYIGLTIQKLIQEQLGIGLADVVLILKSEEDKELTTKEEQNGQDFIIYKNKKPIYYLEVKSKWDDNGRFALSKNQTEKCAIEKDRYGVISVNVDRYKRIHTLNIDNIPFENLKEFVKVNDDLGKDFEKLISENITKTDLNDPKLIEYRGSIPQKIIDDQGIPFSSFLEKLIQKIRTA